MKLGSSSKQEQMAWCPSQNIFKIEDYDIEGGVLSKLFNKKKIIHYCQFTKIMFIRCHRTSSLFPKNLFSILQEVQIETLKQIFLKRFTLA